jgi:hypothetical protein
MHPATSRVLRRAFATATLASAALAAGTLVGCDDGAAPGPADAAETDAVSADAATDAVGGADASSDAGRPDGAELDTGVPDVIAPDTADSDASADAESDVPEVVAPGELPRRFIPQGDEFMVAVLPDTQIYAQSFPETFESQTRWIAEHAEAYRIVFVSHVGDIVQTASVTREWEVASAAYDWLRDIDMPHGFSMGGHDTSPGGTDDDPTFDSSCSPFSHHDCESRNFLRYFGPDQYAENDWYSGSSPRGISSYQRVMVDDLELLFLHLPQDTPRSEVDWASEVLDAHPGALAHLTTHRYLFDYRLTEMLPPPLSALTAGRFNVLTYTLGGQSLMYNDGLEADALWQRLVDAHPNIWTVHCGHVDAEFHQVSTNSAGLPVHEVLVDFQDMADGGGGWLRLLLYRPSQNLVEAITFSTLTGEIREDGAGFEHSIEIVDYYRRAYGSELAAFGLTEDDVNELFDRIENDPEFRQAYYDSLYADGQRNSHLVMDVPFADYVAASR